MKNHMQEPESIIRFKLAFIVIITVVICGLATAIFTIVAYNHTMYAKEQSLTMTTPADYSLTLLDRNVRHLH